MNLLLLKYVCKKVSAIDKQNLVEPSQTQWTTSNVNPPQNVYQGGSGWAGSTSQYTSQQRRIPNPHEALQHWYSNQASTIQYYPQPYYQETQQTPHHEVVAS